MPLLSLPPRMHVLCLTTLFPNTAEPGLGVNVERQLTRLAALPGVALTVVAPIPRLPYDVPVGRYRALGRVPRRDDSRPFPVYHPNYTSLPRVGWRFHHRTIWNAVRPLVRRLHRATPFDLVTGEYMFPDAMPVFRAARDLHLPYILKARGSDVRFWQSFTQPRRQMVGAGRHANGLLAVSASLKRDMAAMGLPSERIAVHYTAVDLDRFSPDAAPRHARPTIVAAGNLVPLKRVDLIIDALVHLEGVDLRIVGQGPERAALERQVQAAGLGDRVTFLGRLGHEELAREFASAHALVHASSSEGLANVWIEALASGTPVVTTDVGGAREVVTPDVGRVVPPDISPLGLAASVREVLAASFDPVAVREPAERFSWARNLDELMRHYRRVTGQGHG